MAADPEVVDDSKPSAPYREPPPPCEKCAAREAARAPLLPFTRDLVECPVCGHNMGTIPDGGPDVERKVDGRKFKDAAWWLACAKTPAPHTLQLAPAIRHPWWAFWRRDVPAAVEIRCAVPESAGPHFHVRCQRCTTLHAMATRNA